MAHVGNASQRAWYRTLRRHPRLLLALSVGLTMIIVGAAVFGWRPATISLIAWNAGIGTYLVMAWAAMFAPGAERIRQKALTQDEGELIILIAAMAAAALSIVAIIAELAYSRSVDGWMKGGYIALGILTLLVSWAFIHTAFALHYAHEYYAALKRKQEKLLDFPQTIEPVYSDFLYFSFVIGTSGQTADVSFLTVRARRIGLFHCIFAFLFNTTVLALMINIAAGLIS